MDIALEELTANSAAIPAAVRLYVSAFPAAERRDVDDWLALLDAERDFRLWEISGDGMFLGFISVWTFRNFLYVEHFAVDDALRGQGVGARVLQLLCERAGDTPVVLEVECPDTGMARRRIAFYGKNGFRLSAQEYIQPPYREGDVWLPLCLMTTDETFLDEHIDDVRAELYKKVYRQ